MKRIAFALLLLLVACSKHETAVVAQPTAPDPCTLISTADLRQITGAALRDGQTGGDDKTVHRCVWQEGGEAGAGSITIAIHVVDIEALLGQLRNIPGNEKVDAGDEAYWSNALNQLTARAGHRLITITWSSGSALDHKPEAVEIAKKVIAAL